MKKLMALLWVFAIQVLVQSVALAQGGVPAVFVRIAKVSVDSVTPVTVVPGTVVSRNDAKLAAEVTGRLLQVADVGTVVASGDMVAMIEDTLLKLKKDEQEAEVQRARARLRFLENEERRFMQ